MTWQCFTECKQPCGTVCVFNVLYATITHIMVYLHSDIEITKLNSAWADHQTLNGLNLGEKAWFRKAVCGLKSAWASVVWISWWGCAVISVFFVNWGQFVKNGQLKLQPSLARKRTTSAGTVSTTCTCVTAGKLERNEPWA